MSVAENQLGIPRLMKPSEIAAHPDQLALLAYLTLYYDTLHDREPQGKAPVGQPESSPFKGMHKKIKSDTSLLENKQTKNNVVLRKKKEHKVRLPFFLDLCILWFY